MPGTPEATPEVGGDWTAFEQRLTMYLRTLMEGEALLLAVRDTPHRVRVVDLGGGFLHGEVSLQRKADPSAANALGWKGPERGLLGRLKTGASTLSADATRADAGRLAAMIVTVLRDVWSVASPQSLSASSPNGGPPLTGLQVPIEA